MMKYYCRGVPHREPSGSTDLKVAEKLLKRRLAEVETKTFVARTNVTIDELFADMKANYKEEGRKTLGDIEARWRLHLQPYFFKMKAADIGTSMVRAYSEKRGKDGACTATLNRELSILKRCFHLGLKSDPPKVQMCPHIPMPRERNERTGFLDDDSYTKLATECSKEGLWLRALITTAWTFAFRKGELLSLRVGQVNLAARSIRLNPGTTKNGKGRLLGDSQYAD
jgi:integrase